MSLKWSLKDTVVTIHRYMLSFGTMTLEDWMTLKVYSDNAIFQRVSIFNTMHNKHKITIIGSYKLMYGAFNLDHDLDLKVHSYTIACKSANILKTVLDRHIIHR